MPGKNGLTTADLLEVFSDEIAAHQGNVTDTFRDGIRLLTRGVLPQLADIPPRDRHQGGVALKATEDQLCLYPYVFRQVCSNGAIWAHAAQSRQIEGFYSLSQDQALSELRQAVAVCCMPQAFSQAMAQIRSSRNREADMMLALMPVLSRFGSTMRSRLVEQIFERFFASRDKSQFGLMQAVTSVARDTADPQVRWQLEELGGAIPSIHTRPRPDRPVGAQKRREAMVV